MYSFVWFFMVMIWSTIVFTGLHFGDVIMGSIIVPVFRMAKPDREFWVMLIMVDILLMTENEKRPSSS